MGKSSGSCAKFTVLAVVAAFVYGLVRLQINGEPMSHMWPNLMLLTSDFYGTVESLHRNVHVDTRVNYPPIEVPFINADEFSIDALQAATDNWRYPAIVRGLFKGTVAVEKWGTPDYLPSLLGKYTVPVVKNSTYNNNQGGRAAMSFGEAFRDIVVNHSSKYLFFPVQSREQFPMGNFSTADLKADINRVVREDLELDRIFPGFGTKSHRAFFGSQLVVGYGQKNPKKTTGTGWHCAFGNNYFAMVVGRKRWYFMDPRYSSYMAGVKGGRVNFQTIRRDLDTVTPHLPLRYADVEAGDLLYNPDWEWHTIQNYEGLSLGVPIRELGIYRSFRNNALYTAITIVNKALEPLGLDLGGYPPLGNAAAKIWKKDYDYSGEL